MSSFYFSYTANFYPVIDGLNLRCNGRFTHSKISVGILLRQAGVYEIFYEFSSRSDFNPGLSPTYVYAYSLYLSILHLISLSPLLSLPSSSPTFFFPPHQFGIGFFQFVNDHLTILLTSLFHLTSPLPLPHVSLPLYIVFICISTLWYGHT